uniref:Zinc finger, CCHC-type n=1 Tax=Tanacetum cinerariifolium TaxID=118510 RepID=A0A6L2LMI2_TANCI|nr:zinc finger, CCHC-type [Tanacetum cinerariifolium]
MAENTMNDMTTNFGKLDKFEGHNFRRWQKKMHFLLTTLKVVYVLTTPIPKLVEDATVEAIRIRDKWENDDYICRGNILNGMSDSLFDVYTNVESAKELWDSLESKYMAEDSSSKKFLESLRAQDSDKGKGKEVDAIAWWIDFSATTHVCKDRCWFKTFKPVEVGSVLYMFDEHFAHVHGKGSVALEFSFGKTVILFDVLYVPKLHKNLVSGHVLNKCGYKQVYESDKYILSKCDVFIGFGYYNNGHVQYKRMFEISKDDLIPAINENPKERTTCMLTKITRAVVRLPDLKRKTLGEKGIDCIFVGYAEHSKAYRLLLALAAIHNLVIHRMDVKKVFLNGELDEEVYMKQPEGFVMPGNEHKVCKLVKSLYGLKQAPKQWHQKFDEVVLSSGFHLNQSDKCVYSKFYNSGKGVIICLYVEDMFIFGTGQNQVDKTKKFLSSRFSMKDMGEANVILGVKIKRENKGIVITQSHYVEKILKKFNRADCSPIEGGAISWASKKQTCITGSTIESDFVALAAAGKEAEWLRNLIHDVPIWPKPIAPISI